MTKFEFFKDNHLECGIESELEEGKGGVPLGAHSVNSERQGCQH